MAFDAAREEYQLLSIRYLRDHKLTDSYGMAREAAAFRRQFARNHDALPQTDQDRAFHLMAQAVTLIDNELPFVEAEDDAYALIQEAQGLLSEAVSLDPGCFDAQRALTAQQSPTREAYYHYLKDGEAHTWEVCQDRAQEALKSSQMASDLEARLLLFPAYRWTAALASHALVCGRYSIARDAAERLLAQDPEDVADARFTAALAYAKLEDGEGFLSLRKRTRKAHNRPAPDAWASFAFMALSAKANDYTLAREVLHQILRIYPHAAYVLSQSSAVPEGIFARMAVEPYSNDELVLATSEALVLLQEGVDLKGYGTLGAFMLQDPLVRQKAEEDERELRAMLTDGPSPLGASSMPEGPDALPQDDTDDWGLDGPSDLLGDWGQSRS